MVHEKFQNKPYAKKSSRTTHCGEGGLGKQQQQTLISSPNIRVFSASHGAQIGGESPV